MKIHPTRNTHTHTQVMTVGSTEQPVPRMAPANTSTGMNSTLNGTVHAMTYAPSLITAGSVV